MGTRTEEYSLADLLADPIIGLMMKSDGVDRHSLERLLAAVGDDRSRSPADEVGQEI